MRCVSVTMLPGYFRSFLPKCFSVDHQELIHSVEGLSDMVTMPELEYLFAQICRINPSAKNGGLYFESKVLELLSLIQIQQEQQKTFPDTSALDEDTIAMIHRLAAFLQNHCDQHLTLETLGKIFSEKSSTDFLIIFSNLRKCWKGLLYQAFPAFCVSEDTPHIMAFRSLIWR